jgi:hypothetical protein
MPRIWDRIIDTLATLNTRGELPDLSALSGFQHRSDATDPLVDGQDDGIAVVE